MGPLPDPQRDVLGLYRTWKPWPPEPDATPLQYAWQYIRNHYLAWRSSQPSWLRRLLPGG